MYTAEQLMPVRPHGGYSQFSRYWTLNKRTKEQHGWARDSCPFVSLTEWIIPIPDAPEEVKPLSYPENKPSKEGAYWVHQKYQDRWYLFEWPTEKTYWNGLADYFIPIRLDEPLGNSEQLEDDMSEVIWENINKVQLISSGDKTLICTHRDQPTLLFKSEWLEIMQALGERFGYDVIKREPEIAPCPNPECHNDKMHLEGCEDDMWYYCHKCGYAGPTANSKSEAGRLHNLIAGRE